MYVGNTNCKLIMSLNSNTLVNEVKDLGVFVDSNLTFHSHIDKIVALRLNKIELNYHMFCFARRL